MLFVYWHKCYVTCLDFKKTYKTNKQLSDLRASSVEQQNKLQNAEEEKEMGASGTQTVKGSVRLINKTATLRGVCGEGGSPRAYFKLI